MGEGGEENKKLKISLDRAHQYNNAGNMNALAEVVPINYSMIVSNSKAMKYEPNLRKCVKFLTLNCRLFVIGYILSIFTTKACNLYIMAQLNLRSRQQCIVYLEVNFSSAHATYYSAKAYFPLGGILRAERHFAPKHFPSMRVSNIFMRCCCDSVHFFALIVL